MAALQQFQLYIKGNGLYSITDSGLYYNELIESFFSPSGRAEASSFKERAYNDLELSYDVTIDTLEYPTLNDYAKKIEEGLNASVKDKKITYEIFKTGGTNPRDVIYFTLDYKYKMEDLERDIKKAQTKYAKEQSLISEYNKAIDKGDVKKAAELKAKLEEAQKLEVTPVTSAAETELEKKAIGTEETAEVTAPPATPPAQVQQAPAVQPVIVTPTEKNTVVSTKEKSKEKSLIESVSSSVFDKKILEYEKSSSERVLASKGSSPEKQPKVSILPEKGGILSESTILKEVQSIERLLTEGVPGIATAAVKSIVPTEVSKIMTTVLSGETSKDATSFIGKEVTDTIKNQVTQAGSIISSISDTVKLMQNSISSVSSTLQDATLKIDSAFNSVAKESSSIVGLATSTIDGITNKLSDVAVRSEKSSSDSTILADIQKKIVGLETVSPLKTELGAMTTNIGNALKSIVTNITEGGKTSTTQVSSPSSVSLTNPTNTSTVNQGETSTANLGSQTNQSFIGGQNAFPSVVSLSQSTIDNLASAIIKNMSITPFLNSGR